MSSKYTSSKSQKREAGMVAIMVTMILMIVISLIVIGFAQISRRNQRQALDRQLSTQAFYAAETGVNDVSEIIQTAVATGSVVADKPDCASTGGGFYAGLAPVLDANSSVEYTCILVDPTPPTLVYSDVGTTSTIVPLTAVSGSIGSIVLNWQTKEDTTTPAATCPNSFTNVFKTTGAWTCGYGVMRIDLVPTSGGGLTFSNLQTDTMSSFIVPFRTGGPANYTYQTNGSNNLIRGDCDNTRCRVTIDTPASTQYYLRMSSLYKDSSVEIQVFAPSGAPASVQGAQALIDATGKAQDVLRRIQVRVPLAGSSTNLLSDYAIESTEAICKRFSVMENYFQSDANNAVPGVSASTANPLCQ